MIEVVPGSNVVTFVDVGSGVRAWLHELRDAVAERAQITWGEHCSEYASVACYSSCPHYTPRSDLHCRRLENGVESVRVASLTDTLMRVRFRKWGKLQGAGPVPMRAGRSALRHEVARNLVGRVADWQVLAYGLRQRAGSAWTKAEAASATRSIGARADAFVVECVSSGQRAVPFALTIVQEDRSEVGRFHQRLLLGPSYTRAVMAADRIARHVDLTEPFFVDLEPLVEAPAETFLFGVADFVKWKSAPAAAIAPVPVKADEAEARNGEAAQWAF